MPLETQKATRSSTTTHRMQTKSVTRSQRHGAEEDFLTHVNSRFTEHLKNDVASNMWEFLGNGSTPSNLNLQTTDSEATVAAVNRNLNHPFINLSGFTATAYWNNRQGQARHGTLITPRHIIAADHYHLDTNNDGVAGQNNTYTGSSFTVGDKLAFKDNKNNTYFRTVVGVSDEILGNTTGNMLDAEVSTLNADLPDSIQPVKLLPPDFPKYVATTIQTVYIPSASFNAETGDTTRSLSERKAPNFIRQPIQVAHRDRYGKWAANLKTEFSNNHKHSTAMSEYKANYFGSGESGFTQEREHAKLFGFDLKGMLNNFQYRRPYNTPWYLRFADILGFTNRPDLTTDIVSGSSGTPQFLFVKDECVFVSFANQYTTSNMYWGYEACGIDAQTTTVDYSSTDNILKAIVKADAVSGANTGYKPNSIDLSSYFYVPKQNAYLKNNLVQGLDATEPWEDLGTVPNSTVVYPYNP
jgi:hypothetical protein